MSQSSVELQRLLHLLMDTATKAEEEAYAAGWRDCHAALLKAVATVTDAPAAAPVVHEPVHAEPAHVEPAPVETEHHAETPNWHSPVSYSNGAAAESSFAN